MIRRVRRSRRSTTSGSRAEYCQAMLGTAVYIMIEALSRIGADAEVSTGPMLVVGALGLAVNIAALVLLRAGASESLNVKGSYLEVLADTAGSVGVIAAGILVAATGQVLFDTLVALAIAVFLVVRAIALGRQVLAVLGQHAPASLDVDTVAGELAAIDGVQDVHDLHRWTLTSGMHVATAHLVTADQQEAHAVLDRARELLRDRHAIAHATLQVEPADHKGCDEVGW
ncbi:cation diffusion facilitator family transporter [Actinomadura sediminis]|uniref:Cation diffusion facilitator family transporter n=1 Tax=Actinomadura sediminis TaxID=1038904 RepID=A0ABW3EY47_9ACTN